MRQVDFLTLKLFTAIADEGNLTKAAEREHLALSAASKRITDLETDLNIQLLYRSVRGVALTPAGYALLHHAHSVLDKLRQLDADLSEYNHGVKGHIRMYANTSSIIQFLPEDLSTFIREHPLIKIDLEEETSSKIVHAVWEGLTDIGIYAGHIPAEGLRVFPYRGDQLMLIAPPDHPLAKHKEVSLCDVEGYDFITLKQGSSLYSLIAQVAQTQKIKLRIRIQVRSFDAICRMIETGLGVGVLPDKAAQFHIHSMRIVGIPIKDDWAKRELKICVRDYNSLSVIAKQMVDHLQLLPPADPSFLNQSATQPDTRILPHS
jgi:DNA-binding transcriptional LysR family regulator